MPGHFVPRGTWDPGEALLDGSTSGSDGGYPGSTSGSISSGTVTTGGSGSGGSGSGSSSPDAPVNDPLDDYTTYDWDNRSRLIKVSEFDGDDVLQEVHYLYDGLNRRVAKRITDYTPQGSESGTETQTFNSAEGVTTIEKFVHDGGHLLAVINGQGRVTEQLVHGPMVDQILAEERFDEAGARTVMFSAADHLGTVRDALTWQDGVDQVVRRIHTEFDAFGNEIQPISPTPEDWRSRFGYTGRDRDPETDLQYNRARYYDARTGSWISQDPIGFAAGDANLYRYVGNGVTGATDPTGLYDAGGHFLTTYIISQIISGDSLASAKLAYYSQLPDIIKDHEAVPQVMNAGKANATRSMSVTKTMAKDWWNAATGRPTITGQAGMLAYEEDSTIAYARQINGILHALHGTDDVQKWRTSLERFVAAGGNRSIQEVGYAIHTFGDTFAHTFISGNGNREAYGWWIGHGSVTPPLSVIDNNDMSGLEIAKDTGHVPDIIAYDYKNYEAYVDSLAPALSGYVGKPITKEMRAEIDEFLGNVKGLAADRQALGNNGKFLRDEMFKIAKEKHLPHLIGDDGSEFLPHLKFRQIVPAFQAPSQSQVEGYMDNIFGAVYPGKDSISFLIEAQRGQ
ncbi:RHS repeat-associated core domain-containing protein [Stieleria varia]|uniref:RHS repeat-associated core domain-containing protein n=1 Tax=Stieleria varia TaxID=2528005 RepID=UPI0011B7248A|nr:RHS repeat-associated core domain-containing protein [Stieleria varia]